MYRENRPLWLKFSKANLKRYPNRKDRYNAFLRECYPAAKDFTPEALLKAKKQLNLAVPIDELIKYGKERNWLTKDGKPYTNIFVFCAVWNGVWLDIKRREEEKKFKENYDNTISLPLFKQDLQQTEQGKR